jgi:hypothetical protein
MTLGSVKGSTSSQAETMSMWPVIPAMSTFACSPSSAEARGRTTEARIKAAAKNPGAIFVWIANV